MPRTKETLFNTSNPRQDREVHDLRGLDTGAADQILITRSPYLRNMRMQAEGTSEESTVTMRTRRGQGYLSDVVGSTLDYNLMGTTPGTNVSISPTTWYARKFTATSDSRLTEVVISATTGTGTGPLMVSIHSDSSGAPGTKIGESSLLDDTTASLTDLTARFVDAPTITNGGVYWVVVKMQDNGTGNYEIATRTDTTDGLTSINSGGTWSAVALDIPIEVYTTTTSAIKGEFVANFEGGSRKLMAANDSLYEINIVTGAVSTVHSGMDSNATDYVFEFHNGKTYWVNGKDDFIYVWDATTVTTITSPELNPYTIAIHENRMFLLGADDRAKMRISALLDFTTWESLGVPIIQYVPDPGSGDPVTRLLSFQGSLICFTKETKYVLYGQDLSSFSLRQTVGVKGSEAPKSIFIDGNYVYFLSDDGVYRFNGADDELLSKKISRALRNMNNRRTPCAVVWNNQYRLYYPSQASPTNNMVAVYNIPYKEWFIDEGTNVGGVFYDMQRDGNPLYEFSSLVAQVYLADSIDSDLGKPIAAKYWTSYQRFNSATQQHRIKKFYPVVRASGAAFNLRLGRSRDFNLKAAYKNYLIGSTGSTWGGGDTWGGGATWGGDKVAFRGTSFSGKSRYSQFRFERTGIDTPIQLYGYFVIYKTSRIR